MIRHLPYLLPALLLVASAQAQDDNAPREVDLQADSMLVSRVGGREVVELLGVRLQEEETVLWADRMIDQGSGILLFTQNVRIVDDGDTLSTDRLRYNRDTKVGRATGAVRLSDGEVVVTAAEGDYDTRSKRADFRYGVTMVDSLSVLTSQVGSYWTEEKRAQFAGGVRLDGREADVVADSITYYRDTELSEAFGNVVISERDSTGEGSIIRASSVRDDPSSGTAEASGGVLLVQLRVDSTGVATDTLYIQAQRLVSIQTDSTESFTAMDSVRVWGGDYVAIADSLVHDIRGGEGVDGSETRLFGSPVGWFRRSQISGDTLIVAGRGSGVDSLKVYGSAFVVQQDSLLDRLQQMKGVRLLGRFEDGALKTLEMAPRAEAIYHLTRDEDQPGGAVRTSADRIQFGFDGDSVDDIRIYGGVEGTYYSEELMTEPLTLPGLRWSPDRRPDRSLLASALSAMMCRFEQCGGG